MIFSSTKNELKTLRKNLGCIKEKFGIQSKVQKMKDFQRRFLGEVEK